MYSGFEVPYRIFGSIATEEANKLGLMIDDSVYNFRVYRKHFLGIPFKGLLTIEYSIDHGGMVKSFNIKGRTSNELEKYVDALHRRLTSCKGSIPEAV